MDVYFSEFLISSIVALERPSMHLERLTSPLLASYRNVVQSYNIPGDAGAQDGRIGLCPALLLLGGVYCVHFQEDGRVVRARP